MRTLAHDSSKVPSRYKIEPHTLSMGEVFATGNFAEVRKGMLGGKTVAVKTPRVDRQTSPRDIKVLLAPNHPF